MGWACASKCVYASDRMILKQAFVDMGNLAAIIRQLELIVP